MQCKLVCDRYQRPQGNKTAVRDGTGDGPDNRCKGGNRVGGQSLSPGLCLSYTEAKSCCETLTRLRRESEQGQGRRLTHSAYT